jgi:glutamine amidotransferase
VGSFDWAMNKLNASGLRPSLEQVVLQKKTPVLGICVGMQMMAESSAEGRMRGLGWIEGKVQKLNEKSLENKRAFGQENHPAEVLILPHMGWNDVHVVGESPLLHLVDKPKFYFLHSYYFLPSESSRTLGITEYGISFCSAVGKKNIYGVQFHPEKSHHWGIQLLKNFYEKC